MPHDDDLDALSAHNLSALGDEDASEGAVSQETLEDLMGRVEEDSGVETCRTVYAVLEAYTRQRFALESAYKHRKSDDRFQAEYARYLRALEDKTHQQIEKSVGSDVAKALLNSYQLFTEEAPREDVYQWLQEAQKRVEEALIEQAIENSMSPDLNREERVAHVKEWSEAHQQRLDELVPIVKDVKNTLYKFWSFSSPDIEKKFKAVTEACQTLLRPENQASARYYVKRMNAVQRLEGVEKNLQQIMDTLHQQQYQLEADKAVCEAHRKTLQTIVESASEASLKKEAKEGLSILKKQAEVIDKQLQSLGKQSKRLLDMQDVLIGQESAPEGSVSARGLLNAVREIDSHYPLEIRLKSSPPCAVSLYPGCGELP